MKRYVKFDPVQFLQDSKGWAKKKRQLEAELKGVAELKGGEGSPSRSGRVSDTVPITVMERHEIQRQIDRISLYQEALIYVRKRLSEAQNDVIDAFFFRGGYVSRNIEDYGQKYGLCRTDVYAARREALAEFRRVITEKYL